MKFSLSVTDAQHLTRLARDVAAPTVKMPEFSGVLIKTSSNQVEAFAYSDELRLRVVVPAVVEEEGVVAVDAIAMYNAVSKLGQYNDSTGTGVETVVFSLGKTKHVNVSFKQHHSGTVLNQKRSLPTVDHTVFPEFPEVRSNTTIQISADSFADSLTAVVFAASDDKQMAVLNGVLFSAVSQSYKMAATDGVVIAERSGELDSTLVTPVSCVIPLALTSRISRAFYPGDVAKLKISSRVISFETPSVTLLSSLISGEFPDYQHALPKDAVSAIVDKSMLKDAISGLTYPASKVDHNRVSLEFNNGTLSLRCGEDEVSGMPTDYKGSRVIDCDLRLLAMCVRPVEDDIVSILIPPGLKPLQFSGSEGSRIKTALVPLNNV